MKFFKLVRSGIDVTAMLTEVRSQEQFWMLNSNRQNNIKVQRNTNTIFISAQIRRRDLPPAENQETKFTRASKWYPQCVAFLSSFASEMNARLSRATIVRLTPRSQVLPHVDMGSYYFIRDRYHLVLYSKTGSVLISGGEQVRMQPGELWWFNNKQYHEAHNDSDEWRIHYIFDLLPIGFAHLATNPIKPPPSASASETVESEKEIVKPTHRDPRDLLLSAIAERAILRAENQRLVGPNGNNNSWLIDLRRLFMEAPLLDALSELFWELVGDKLPFFQVGCMEVAAIPLVAAILMKSANRGTPINGFVVRKERKTYGTGGLIEGIVTDDPIIVVDDILNSGSSVEKVRVVLERENKRISLVLW